MPGLVSSDQGGEGGGGYRSARRRLRSSRAGARRLSSAAAAFLATSRIAPRPTVLAAGHRRRGDGRAAGAGPEFRSEHNATPGRALYPRHRPPPRFVDPVQAGTGGALLSPQLAQAGKAALLADQDAWGARARVAGGGMDDDARKQPPSVSTGRCRWRPGTCVPPSSPCGPPARASGPPGGPGSRRWEWGAVRPRAAPAHAACGASVPTCRCGARGATRGRPSTTGHSPAAASARGSPYAAGRRSA
jgi:hypothetical protein